MQKQYKFARLSVLILAVSTFLVVSRSASAARFVRFEVSIDGNIVLRTSTGDHGTQDADTVWRYLENLHFGPVSDGDIRRHTPRRPQSERQGLPVVKGYKVEPDQDNPLQATLEGRVVVESAYGGRAEVAELTLVRDDEDAPWKLAPAEVERTFKSRHKPFVFGVSIDGEKVLYTPQETTTGNHAEDADTVWRHLKHLEFLPITSAKGKGPQYVVQADSENPTQGRLQGNIVVRLSYGGHSWGEAKVSELKFVRSKTAAWRWKFDPAEVERTLEGREKPE